MTTDQLFELAHLPDSTKEEIVKNIAQSLFDKICPKRQPWHENSDGLDDFMDYCREFLNYDGDQDLYYAMLKEMENTTDHDLCNCTFEKQIGEFNLLVEDEYDIETQIVAELRKLLEEEATKRYDVLQQWWDGLKERYGEKTESTQLG